MIRFRLRSLFVLVVTAAILSELLQWATGARESPFVVGFGYFAYGGIVGLTVYVCAAILSMIASQSAAGQRVGVMTGAAVSTIVWLSFVIAPTISWVPVWGIYSALVVTLMVFVTKSDLVTDESISPQRTMERLHRAKDEVLAQEVNRSRDPRHAADTVADRGGTSDSDT